MQESEAHGSGCRLSLGDWRMNERPDLRQEEARDNSRADFILQHPESDFPGFSTLFLLVAAVYSRIPIYETYTRSMRAPLPAG